MDWAALLAAVRAHAAAERAFLGLGDGPVDVAWIENLGGFENASFRVSDGARAVRLKLVGDARAAAALRRVHEEAATLTARYRAPPTLGWTTLPGGRWEGPVLAWIDGATPDVVDGDVREQAGEALVRLHGDDALAARLAVGTPAARCADAFVRAYGGRFREDLDELARERPPFVSAARLAWMRREAAALVAGVTSSAAFDVPAERATHGDLWPENVLVGRDGRVWILDWDDLAPGDPAMDWAMLLGPAPRHVRRADAAHLPAALAADPAFVARFDVYARAALLDCVIDPLADWTAAGVLGDGAAAFRATMRRLSDAAEEAYRAAP